MIENYLIAVPFPADDLSLKYKDDMVAKFRKDKIENIDDDRGYNTEFDNELYRNNVASEFLKVVRNTFEVSEHLRDIRTWIYCQNNQHNRSVWHNHMNTSTVNAVFYIDPPEEQDGGGLEVCLGQNVFTIPVKKNFIYMFPYWMDHRPLAQKSEKWRVSVNVEYFCNTRPIVKKNGVLW